LSELQKEIETLISSHQTSMSKYQIDHFVIGEKMTPYRILKQILLELESRYRNLDDVKDELTIHKIKAKKLKKKISKEKDEDDKAILDVKLRKKQREIKSLEKSQLNNEYEIKTLEEQYRNIKAQYPDTQALLTDEAEEQIYWVNKFIKEAQVDIMTGGRIGKGVLDAIMTLPEELQNVVVQNAVAQAASSNGFISAVEDHHIDALKESKKVALQLSTVIGQKIDEDEEK
jgi:hypothetical protein